jgi:hypothetical protein
LTEIQAVKLQKAQLQIPTIKRNFSTLVVPFVFDKDYKEVVKFVTSSNNWSSKKNKNRQKLYEHIQHLAVEEEADEKTGTIGRIFNLTETGYESAGLPKNIKSNPFTIKKKEKEYTFRISETNLYLFETNIGFLVFELEYPKDIHIDSYIETNNILKNIKPHRGVTWEMFTGKQTPSIEIHLSEITERILVDFKVSSYFESEKDVPIRGLMFNSIVIGFEDYNNADIQEYKNELKRYLFELRRLFSSSYKPSPEEFKIENNNEILQTFDNSYWGVALEGVANIAYLINDEHCDSFFKNSYISTIKSTYFYIYMISLHQRYALLNLSIRSSKLLIQPSVNVNNDSTITVRGLRKEMIFFTLRSAFKHVSSVTHHGKVYKILNDTLQIDELNKELHFELEILDSMIEAELHEELKLKEKEQLEKEKQVENERKEREQQQSNLEKRSIKNREKFQDNLLILSNIFVVISTLSATWSLLSPFFNGEYPALWSKGFYLIVLIFSTVIISGITGVFLIFRKLKEYKVSNLHQ